MLLFAQTFFFLINSSVKQSEEMLVIMLLAFVSSAFPLRKKMKTLHLGIHILTLLAPVSEDHFYN